MMEGDITFASSLFKLILPLSIRKERRRLDDNNRFLGEHGSSADIFFSRAEEVGLIAGGRS